MKSEIITAIRKPFIPILNPEIKTMLKTKNVRVVKIPSAAKSLTNPLALTKLEQVCRKIEVQV